MSINGLNFTIGFWHPFGPHAGEGAEEIVARKKKEIDQNGWTLWSFQFRRTLGDWYAEIEKAKPDRVLVFCSNGNGAKDPLGTPRDCNYYIPVDTIEKIKMPSAIHVPHPLGDRTEGSAFMVKNIIYPVESTGQNIEWLRGDGWQTTELPTRPEYLIRPGQGQPMRPYRAVLELQAPYLAIVGID